MDFSTAIALLPAGVAVYAYLFYPVALWIVASARRRRANPPATAAKPSVTIVLFAYNEAGGIAATLDALLGIDFSNAIRSQLLVVSDSSTDGTDEIVQGFAGRGVEYARTPRRMGKTAAENHTLPLLRGDIIVNTDAAVRVHPAAVRELIRALEDPAVGLASGLDVSVSSALNESNAGESHYVSYEMWVRDLETRAGGIVGASGCLFAIRRALHVAPVPTDCLRDFAAPLMVRTLGYRSVSVPSAICYVPRTASLRSEYRRKVRTFALGMGTLRWQRRNLNPANGLLFAWKLFSHKVCRYLLPWTLLTALVSAAVSGSTETRLVLATTVLAAGGSVLLALRWPWRRPQPHWLSFISIVVASSVAVIHATLRAARQNTNHLWEPTRRSPVWLASQHFGGVAQHSEGVAVK